MSIQYLHDLLASLNMVHFSRLIGHAHLGRIRAVWHPLGTGHWSGLLQHSVDLLKSQTLCLRDQEVCVDEANSTEGTPKEEDLWSKINTATSS